MEFKQRLGTSMVFATMTFLTGTLFATAVSADDYPMAVSDADFYNQGSPNPDEVMLGKFLFFDKILSGNKNTSCATCHHALTDTGDGLSLPVGEGGHGLGVTRDTGTGAHAVYERVPRNAPPVFNLGAKSMSVMFHDGRVSVDATQPSGFRTPAGDDLPMGLNNALAAQAMFPVTSATEMAGQAGENPVADAAAMGDLAGPNGVWAQLAQRLRQIPEYVSLFDAAYGIGGAEISMVYVANAIAVFEAEAWRADNSAFDRYLRGHKKALSKSAKKGMRLFYGKANCARCHSGKFQTDNEFHAIAMPQIGPGKGHDLDGHGDFGREAVSGMPEDRYRFRTPSLRNVALTGPWGHDGAYNTLLGVIEHHLNPVESIMAYDCETEPVLPSRADLDAVDCVVQNDPARVAEIAQANELQTVILSNKEKMALVDFLHALTDPASVDLRTDVPAYLPSGLSLAE